MLVVYQSVSVFRPWRRRGKGCQPPLLALEKGLCSFCFGEVLRRLNILPSCVPGTFQISVFTLSASRSSLQEQWSDLQALFQPSLLIFKAPAFRDMMWTGVFTVLLGEGLPTQAYMPESRDMALGTS